MGIKQITATELQIKIQEAEDLLLLDVREPYEYQFANIGGSVLIPMNQIQQRLKELNPELPTVVICHHGIRSQQVAEFLVHSEFTQLYNLIGGIDSWSLECDASVPRY